MNRRILVLPFLSIFLSISTLYAQPVKSTWLTASLGLNSTWIINQNSYGNPELDYSTKFGLSGMIGLNHYLDNKYGLTTGIGLANFGQNYHGEQKGADASRKVTLNYIVVPLFGMKQLRDSRQPCWLTFGPQIMILTSAHQKYSRDADAEVLPHPEYLPSGKTDVTKWYRPVDVMLNVGYTNLYYMRMYDNLRMMLSFNAALGLFDINSKNPDYHLTKTGKAYKGSHNFYFGVHCGFMFNP
jgi:hypothetical protein